jgi:hypothetical protein
MRKSISIAVVLILFVAALLLAQQPPAGQQQGRGGGGGQMGAPPAPAPSSAQVSPDGRVTFRLAAPKATEVLVNGNWEGGRGVAMSKEASGIWSVTVGPLQPELWTYTFSVDGLTTLDPGNYNVIRDGTRYMNSVLVPGPTLAFLQTGRIPHGTVSAVWYPSTWRVTATTAIQTVRAPR